MATNEVDDDVDELISFKHLHTIISVFSSASKTNWAAEPEKLRVSKMFKVRTFELNAALSAVKVLNEKINWP